MRALLAVVQPSGTLAMNDLRFAMPPPSAVSSDAPANVLAEPAPGIRMHLSEAIGMLSYALDLTEGQPPGHCVRCCWIGTHIGLRLGLDAERLSDLYYTLLLKDAGCSSNAARLWQLYGGDERLIKHGFKTVDSHSLLQLARFVLRYSGPGEALRNRVQRVLNIARHGEELAGELIHTRCERGADIVRRIGFNESVAAGVYCLDEHWNGQGKTGALCEEQIPLNARIALLTQVVDVFHSVGGPQAALDEARRRSGSWFDPRLVAALQAVSVEPGFWDALAAEGLDARVGALEPVARTIMIDEDRLDVIASAFADIIDAKSSFTGGHSHRVMQYAEKVAARLGVPAPRRRWLRRGALLHDIGKLGVSNSILDKPGRLDAAETLAMQRHAVLSEEILVRLSVFRDLAPIAAAHHERLDGKGYPKRLGGDAIALETRILTVADIFDALTAGRPYRAAMPRGEALAIMQREVGTAIDARCFDALFNLAHEVGEVDGAQRRG
jgi:putative nucleotidyltransferase with HDIG domain